MKLSFAIISSFAVCIPAIVLDVNDPGERDKSIYPLCTDNKVSIRDAAKVAAQGAQDLYQGNTVGGTVGKWPFPPYYCK